MMTLVLIVGAVLLSFLVSALVLPVLVQIAAARLLSRAAPEPEVPFSQAPIRVRRLSQHRAS